MYNCIKVWYGSLMKIVTAVIAAAALAVTLSACGSEDKLDGKVTGKSVDPGYTYVYMQPMYTTTCSGNPSVCRQTVYTYIPITYSVPPCYKLQVKGKVSGLTCVDQDMWEHEQIGDSYLGPDADARDKQKKQS